MDDNKKMFLIQMKIFSKLKKIHIEINHDDALFCRDCIQLCNYLIKVIPLDELI